MFKLWGKGKTKEKPQDPERLAGLQQLVKAQYSQFCATNVFAQIITEDSMSLWNWLEARENPDKTWSIMRFYGVINPEQQTVVTINSEKMAQKQNIPFWQVLETMNVFEQGSLNFKDTIIEQALKRQNLKHFHDVARTEGCVFDTNGDIHVTQGGVLVTEGHFSPGEIEKTQNAIANRPSIQTFKTTELSGYFMSVASLTPQAMREFTPEEQSAIEKEKISLQKAREHIHAMKKALEDLVWLSLNFEKVERNDKMIKITEMPPLYEGNPPRYKFKARAKFFSEETESSRYYLQSEVFDTAKDKISKASNDSFVLQSQERKIKIFLKEVCAFARVLSIDFLNKHIENPKEPINQRARDYFFESLKWITENKEETALLQNHIMRGEAKAEIPPSIAEFFTSFDKWYENNAKEDVIVFAHKQEKERKKTISVPQPKPDYRRPLRK